MWKYLKNRQKINQKHVAGASLGAGVLGRQREVERSHGHHEAALRLQERRHQEVGSLAHDHIVAVSVLLLDQQLQEPVRVRQRRDVQAVLEVDAVAASHLCLEECALQPGALQRAYHSRGGQRRHLHEQALALVPAFLLVTGRVLVAHKLLDANLQVW
eukprot:CAMPEP_0114443644 /NCGR_PEP_ID=MMETSP0103-20121206/17637_1 /TAXON_ID=37642 ORGANISM="Paraphysomonas imperforata, Strain PA2" /NCGR_SAMPLE_ID=MMETSP0103 /ASSEMBLY_ACC=CAM_ASM_000201 /LENGTH=157 /DNA_ID=CAMNT_0001615077 /DNA_START=94 /DNA_END=564 /DNA_ORIENTATION=-